MTPVSAHLNGIHAHLNRYGKQVWGYVFPDCLVPVLSMTPVEMFLGDAVMKAYLVDWDSLEPTQRGDILKHLAETFKSPENVVEAAILKNGLPLRDFLVSTVVVDRRFLV